MQGFILVLGSLIYISSVASASTLGKLPSSVTLPLRTELRNFPIIYLPHSRNNLNSFSGSSLLILETSLEHLCDNLLKTTTAIEFGNKAPLFARNQSIV